MNSFSATDRLLLAARHPLVLFVVLVMLGTGIFVDWRALPVGIVALGLMIWFTAGDPSLITAPTERPKLAKITSRAFQAHLDAIDRTREQIARSTNSAAGPLLKLLQPIADQANKLYAQANGLASKGQIIEQYLHTASDQQLQGQINELDRRISGTSDTYTRDQLIETRAALIDRQHNSQALATYYDRITAQLLNISANLENVLAETVRLRASQGASASTTSTEVTEQLRNLNADMDAFQHVLEGALSQSGAA